MLAVILAGGKGTRLRPFTITIPKPLLPVGEVAILEVVLRQLTAHGVSRVVITLGHLGHLVMGYLGEVSVGGLNLDYVTEDEPLGTAGSLRLVQDLPETFLVMNGDLLTTINYRELYDRHIESAADATVAVRQSTVAIDYGVIEKDESGMLVDYVEKPVIPYCVSMGINVLSRDSLRHIPPAGKFDMPQLLLAMQRAGKKVYCYQTDCYWQDIGRFDDYKQASQDFADAPARFMPS